MTTRKTLKQLSANDREKYVKKAKQIVSSLQKRSDKPKKAKSYPAPRENSARYSHGEKSQTLAEWAREKGIPYQILYNRIHIHGWEPEKAIATPYSAKGAKSDLPDLPLAKQPLSVKVPDVVDRRIRRLSDKNRIEFLREAIIEAAKRRFVGLEADLNKGKEE